jgi:hypothetical protein
MAFGQAPGPPATARQREELLTLLQAAGHLDFRDARGPMGFNQRQAGGRFTRVEADELIARLQEDGSEEAAPPVRDSRPPPPRRSSPPDRSLHRIPDEQLAAELRRRGWTVERDG